MHTSPVSDLPADVSLNAELAREKLQAALILIDEVQTSTARQAARCSPITEEDVLAILSARKSRGRFLPDDLFADPAWDLLLQLYAAELGQRRMSVSSLCDGAGVPATTALRWITALESRGLLTRSHDPLDRRRIFLSLSGKGSKAMRSYFAEYGASPVC